MTTVKVETNLFSHSSSQQTSPEENAKEFASGREVLTGENWKTEDEYSCVAGNDAEYWHSFTASMHIDTETSGRSKCPNIEVACFICIRSSYHVMWHRNKEGFIFVSEFL